MTADFPVHPVAAIFPMMTEEELADLAADIKANGLQFPIVLDADGKTLVDGRNRRKACEIAGVEPQFRRLNGEDPAAFIMSANVARRHLTTGQIAMALALARRSKNLPDPEGLGGRGKRGGRSDLARIAGVPQQRLAEAELVIEYAPEMVEEVMSNNIRLDRAFGEAQRRRQAKEWRTDGLAKLRRAAPEFAARVDKGELTVEEARTLLAERDKAEEQVRQTIYQMLADYARLADGLTKTPRVQELPDWLSREEYEEEFRRYFKGGAADLEASIDSGQRLLQVLGALKAQLPKARRTAQ